MTVSHLNYGTAMRGRGTGNNRAQIMNLLRPGMYQYEGQRGIPFTAEEEEWVIDAYFSGGGASAAKQAMLQLVARPLVVRLNQLRLRPLRSVSSAYKLSQIPTHFRSEKEKTNVYRRSTQKAPRRTPQAPDPGWRGGAQAGYDPRDYLNYTVSSSSGGGGGAGYLVSQQYANQLQGIFVAPGGLVHFPIGMNPNQAFMPMVALQPPPPVKPLPTEVKAGEIVAWRCWKVRPGNRLASMAMETIWEPGIPMQGKPSNGDGVHAWKTRAQAEAYGRGGPAYVIGRVELWGEVIEHDEGYRAEYGAIHSLVGGVGSAQLWALELAYGLSQPAVGPAGTLTNDGRPYIWGPSPT